MKNGDEKMVLPLGRSVPAMDSSIMNAITAKAKRAEVSSRSATLIVVQYGRSALQRDVMVDTSRTFATERLRPAGEQAIITPLVITVRAFFVFSGNLEQLAANPSF